MKYIEEVPNNSLEGAFMRYVSDAYENGEFVSPEVTFDGDPWDNFDGGYELASPNIIRSIGDTAVFEILVPENNTISLDDGTVLQETEQGNMYLWNDTSGVHTLVFGKDGTLYPEPKADTPLTLQYDTPPIIESMNELRRHLDEE